MGRTYSCWMLNCWCITWPVGFKRLSSPRFFKSVLLMLSTNSLQATSLFTFSYILFRSFSLHPRFSIYLIIRPTHHIIRFHSILGIPFPFHFPPQAPQFPNSQSKLRNHISLTIWRQCIYIYIYISSPTVPAFSSIKLKIAFPSTTLYSSAFEYRWVWF